jgi:membrane-associated phospholipid phosphatase
MPSNHTRETLTKRQFIAQGAAWGSLIGGGWLACQAAQAASNPSTAGRRPSVWLPLELADAPPVQQPDASLGGRGGKPPNAAKATYCGNRWTNGALNLVVKYQQNPLRAARMLAYLHVGMHDAWTHATQISGAGPHWAASAAETAVHRAASMLLEHFYPNESPGYFAVQFVAAAAAIVGRDDACSRWGRAVGEKVADALIQRSLRDGAGRVWPIKSRPDNFPGMWQAAYPMYAVNPADGFAGQWRPWVTPDPSRYTPPVALRPDDSRYDKAVAEVVAVATTLSAHQTEVAEKWHLQAGSVTAAGIWIRICAEHLALKAAHMSRTTPALPDPNAVALTTLSHLSVAMHDAFIACWQIKFRDWSERPVTAIRRTTDPSFVPLLVTPGFPGYVSGHATVSAAAASVLSRYWPRNAAQFAAMAEEAAVSRLWGGIHFRHDNEEGLKLGQSVAMDIAAARTIAPYEV